MTLILLSEHKIHNNIFYIFKGNYLGSDCITLFKSPCNTYLVKKKFYSIDFLLFNLYFISRMYISEITNEESIIEIFYKSYLNI